jgi:type IX secretion system PorP/SprF family membrane protein
MINFRKFVLITFFGVYCSTNLFGQDPIFTQNFANRLNLNPALTGLDDGSRLGFSYRNQWPTTGANYLTNSVMYDQVLNKWKSGVGLLIMHDQQGNGILKEFTVATNYAYHQKISEKFKLHYGIQAKFGNRGLNFVQINIVDSVVSSSQSTYKVNYFDVSAGIMAEFGQFYGGFAWHHLNRPNVSMLNSYSPLSWKFTGHIGYNFELLKNRKPGNQLVISPNLIYQNQEGFQLFLWGSYFTFKQVSLGLWHRQRDAIMGTLGYELKRFRFAYSYDHTISKLSNHLGGSHELSLNFKLTKKKVDPNFKPILPVF